MTYPSPGAFRYLTQSCEWSGDSQGRLASYCIWEVLHPMHPAYAREDESWLLEMIGYEPDRRAKEYLLAVVNARLENAQIKRRYSPSGEFFERLIQTVQRQVDSLTTAKVIGVGLDVFLRGAPLHVPFLDWAAQRITDDVQDDATLLRKTSIYKDYCPDGERLSLHADNAGKMAQIFGASPHTISSFYTTMCATLVAVPMVGEPIIIKSYEQSHDKKYEPPHERTKRLRITEKKKRLVSAIGSVNMQGCVGLNTVVTGASLGKVTADVRDLFPEPLIQMIDRAWQHPASAHNLHVSPINLQILPALMKTLRAHLNTICARPLSLTYDRGYPVVRYVGPKDFS